MFPDETDLQILAYIQANARISNAEIARRLKMAPSAIFERIRKLEKKKVIQGYTARLDPKALDVGLLAFVFIKTSEKDEKWDVGTMAAQFPEVLEVHDIAGEDCYLIKVRTKDTDSLYTFLRDKLGRIDAVTALRTTIVLRTTKETSKLRLKLKSDVE